MTFHYADFLFVPATIKVFVRPAMFYDILERRRLGIDIAGQLSSNSQLSAWESKFSIFLLSILTKSLRKNVRACTVHALPDLRVAAGRL
jgi:hypothetical protein